MEVYYISVFFFFSLFYLGFFSILPSGSQEARVTYVSDQERINDKKKKTTVTCSSGAPGV